MSKLSFGTLEMPGAELDGENPLPDLAPFNREQPAIVSEVPPEDSLHVGYGRVKSILPYCLQDQYDRTKKLRSFRTAVLENDRLRAVFLPDLGGRLWSIVHKPDGRELLYRNPVFQPANLALRNAWFSGGVEWNIGMTGHTPFTCAPLHMEKLEDSDGTPVLRFYEWERIRQATYQMDFYLPEHSEFLFARMRVVNNLSETVPMYWWSNIAVPEALDVRVIVPAEKAYNHSYDLRLRKIDIPSVRGSDISYSTNCKKAVDYFFFLPDGTRRWIAAVGSNGKGLVQASTSLLMGRKLFAWGMGTGGRHWQEYLSAPVLPYIEIQAGLARTQMECLPMPAKAEWEWLEAYGSMEADPNKVHGMAWSDAVTSVESELDRHLPEAWLENELARTRKSIADKAGELASPGSGWAALENLRREHAGQELLGQLTGFAKSLIGEEQKPWAELLSKGEFPYSPPLSRPGSWMNQKDWMELLESAVSRGKGDHWLSWLHIGVLRYAAGDYEGAEKAWQESLAREPSPWACRNLAICAASKDDFPGAADLMRRAHNMLPGELSITKELLGALLKAGRACEAIDLYEGLAKEMKALGRMKLLHMQALLAAGRLDDCSKFFETPFDVYDIREGEVSITDLWFRLQELLLAKSRNAAVDAEIKQEVAENFFPPRWMDFR